MNQILSIDYLGRALLGGFFAIVSVYYGEIILLSLPTVGSSFVSSLRVSIAILSLMYSGIIVVLSVIRFRPISESLGWSSRIVAILGTFLTLALPLLPSSPTPDWLRTLGVMTAAAGLGLSIVTLAWLRRSFSIDAQARRLVTGGPYAIVRHPLYLCEAVTVIGLLLTNLSVASISLVLVSFLFQFTRILNEERVLLSALPQYGEYAAKTPMLVPFSRRSQAKVPKSETATQA